MTALRDLHKDDKPREKIVAIRRVLWKLVGQIYLLPKG